MPVQASHTSGSEVVLVVTLSVEERGRVLEMLGERIQGEFELAQDLCALGRPFDEPVSRAALCIRVAAATTAAVAAVRS